MDMAFGIGTCFAKGVKRLAVACLRPKVATTARALGC